MLLSILFKFSFVLLPLSIRSFHSNKMTVTKWYRAKSEVDMNDHKFHGRNKKFIPASVESRIKTGRSSSHEMDRAFEPSKNEKEFIARRLSIGFTGVIFSLEGVLVDLSEVYKSSYDALALDMNTTLSLSHPDHVLDCIGRPLHDALVSFGVHVPKTRINDVENRFFDILDHFMTAHSFRAQPGAFELLEQLFKNGDQICILSALPRPLAVKALVLGGLTPILENYLDPSMLVFPDHLSELHDDMIDEDSEDIEAELGLGPRSAAEISLGSAKYRPLAARRESLIIRCCGLMRKPTYLTVLVDRSRHRIFEAKRLGVNVMGLRGYSVDAAGLRAADKVYSSLFTLTPRDIYQVARTALGREDGPEMQAQAAPNLIRSRPSLTASPVAEPPRPKDTFADEFGSDQF